MQERRAFRFMANNKLILNRYRPMVTAGKGGFGTVQVAWDMRIQRKVAIKCIQLSDSDAYRAYLTSQDPAAQKDLAVSETSATPEDIASEIASEAASETTSTFEAASETTSIKDYETASISATFDADNVSEKDSPQHFLANIPGLDEARTAAMLSDANIVSVYDFEVQGNVAYLIMEYVEGMTLTQLLRDYSDEITLDMIAAIFSNVAHALDVAHAHQVLHLDIKPDNVLIDHQGNAKVTDFGLATLADASGCGRAGGGTIGYMPPEQMRQELLDVRCDEWALASLTYEMLAGENPFAAPTLEKSQAAIAEAELVLPSLCWDDMDEDLDDVIFSALDPDAQGRYASVSEFARALLPYLGDADIGKEELAHFVGGAENSFDDEVEDEQPHQMWVYGISDKAGSIIARVFSGASCALLALVAAANMPFVQGWESPALWAIVALALASAAIKPHIGALLSFSLLGVSAFLNNSPVLGALIVALTIIWWFLAGRAGNKQACAALAQPLFGALGLAPVAPVMAGCFLGVRDAILTATFSALCAFAMSGYGTSALFMLWSGGPSLSAWNVRAALPNAFWVSGFPGTGLDGFLSSITEPAAWCTAESWVLAAFAFSIFCLRGTRAFDIAGAIVSCVLLLVGACISAWLSTQFGSLSLAELSLPAALFRFVFPAAIAGAIGVLAAIMRVTDRVRWEDEVLLTSDE